MATQEEIQGYAKTLYQENKLKACILNCTTLLSLEYLDKLQNESQSLYIPDLVRNLQHWINTNLPDFFREDELWLDSSRFILGWLECWNSDPKFTRAAMREFQPLLVSPSGHTKANQVKTLQQAEDFMIGVSASRVTFNLSEKLNIPNLSIGDLKQLLGLPQLETYKLNQTFIDLNTPLFINENKPLSATTIISNIKIKPNKSKIKKNQLQNLIRHLPEDIAKLKIECSECSTKFSPNWFKFSKSPLIPVKPNDHDGSGRWIPRKTYETCPSCEEMVSLDLPIVKMQSKVMLFGDEAYREEQGKLIFTYSLVGAHDKMIPIINESLQELKLELCPSECPDSWAFHMKELWSGDNRSRHRIFSNWDIEKVHLVIRRLFQLIQSHAQHIFMYNIALTTKKPRGFNSTSALDKPKDNAYITLVMYVIHSLTTAKAQPVLTFDAEKRTDADQVIQGWARDAFNGSQHITLYPFLAHGIEVPEPIFVKPSSQPCLELADFVSYIIARMHLKKWQGQEIEEILHPRNLGKVIYLGFDKTDHLVFDTTESYPWELFYGSEKSVGYEFSR